MVGYRRHSGFAMQIQNGELQTWAANSDSRRLVLLNGSIQRRNWVTPSAAGTYSRGSPPLTGRYMLGVGETPLDIDIACAPLENAQTWMRSSLLDMSYRR
jgi:hypothetical protein